MLSGVLSQIYGAFFPPKTVYPALARPSLIIFDYLLEEKNIVGTPGVGFGPHGEGYFRLTAFGTKENTETAVKRITGQ